MRVLELIGGLEVWFDVQYASGSEPVAFVDNRVMEFH